MADPLSIAGSIAGLISLTDTVFRLVFKYARSAANAEQEVKLLADEIQALAGVLQSLRLLASGLEAEGHLFDPTIRAHHLGSLSGILNRLQERAKKAHDKFENSSKTQKTLQQLKWPFSTGDTKGLLEDLVRHKTTISLALSADSLRKLQVCLTKQEEQRETLSSIENIVRKIEINTQITLNDHKKAVLDFFMKVSPQPNLEISVKLREPMTGLWLTGSPSFTTWMETPGSKLWLSGIPGAGKTVLAGAVIQDAIERSDSHSEVGIAFFFCDYKNEITWNIVNILGAIASQISQQNDDAFNSLTNYYNQLHPAGRLAKSPDTEDLRDKITEMSKYFKQTIVIVDGLDECGDDSDIVSETLSDLANYTTNMSMALFSRREVNIQEWLQADFEHIEIAANSNDVRLYVAAEMEKRIQNRRLRILNMELKDEIMNKLVDGAKGMFRWVACQLDYLCEGCVNDADRRKALTELPPDLPETYRRLLERLNRCNAKVKSLVQMSLQFIAFASPKLTIIQLQQAVSVPETPGVLVDSSYLIPAEEIARRCSSLIRKSENGRHFEFSHFSVQEFLTNASLLNSSAMETYYISDSRSSTLLAMQCLRFLQLKNFERHPEPSEQEVARISQRNHEYSFYEYAAVWWPKFARGHLEDPVLLNLADSLFQRHKTPCFVAWSIEFLRHIRFVRSGPFGRFDKFTPLDQYRNDDVRELKSFVRKIQDHCFSPLHLAAALAFPQICQSLLNGISKTNCDSAWGSPLELAAVGLMNFDGMDVESHQTVRWDHLSEKLALYSNAASKDRTATIELLAYAGAVITASSSKPEFNLLDLSFWYATESLDISTSTKLISLGGEPGSKGLDSFSKCMSVWRTASEFGLSRTLKMKDSLRDFLSQLISTSKYKTDTGRKIISLAWATASQLSSDLESDFGLVDAHSACIEDFLRAKVMSAVVADDAVFLREFLNNGNIDILKNFGTLDRAFNYSCSLLHLAVNNSSNSALQILLDVGCDLGVQDSRGQLPIHGSLDNLSILDLLLKRGANHLAKNSNGQNIWHQCMGLYDDDEVIKRLLELDQNQTTEALLTRTSSGQTPLLAALDKPNGDCDSDIPRVLAVIDHCAGKPVFWKAHGPVFAAAVKFGSATVIEHLLQAGAEPDPVEDDQFTPLHKLGGNTTPACARILQEIYPEAHILRFRGLTPLEGYIEKATVSGKMIDPEVLAVLATPEALSSQNMHGETVWSFCCKKLLTRSLGWIDRNNLYSEFDRIVSLLLRLGALASFEERKRESGILPLFSALGLEHKQTKMLTTDISHETLSAVIQKSKYWDDARRSPAAVSFLQKAVEDKNLAAVKLVLEHGVDLHQRVDQISPMEFAVSKFSIAHELLTLEEANSKEIVIALLSHAALDEVKNTSPYGLGLGLMHMIAKPHPKGKMHTYWLLQELIRRGVDINGEAMFKPGWTPLVHHLSDGAFQTAEMLLGLGANPIVNSIFDPVHESLFTGGVTFLKRLLQYSKETGTLIQWNGMREDVGIQNDSTKLETISPIHIIAYEGLNEILDLYLDEDLLDDINVTTDKGHTAVHWAAANNQAAVINRLHNKGASLNVQSDDGSTALHLAARDKNLSAAKTLLELGAQSSLDAFAMTPRMYASASKDEEMTKLLDSYLSLDVKPSTIIDVQLISRKRKKYLEQSLEDAIEKNDLEKCQRLHRAGCSLDAHMSKSCSSPLMTALADGQLQIVEWLLICGATTLTIPTHADRRLLSTIEFALTRASLNPILKQLLRRYEEQGGELISDDYFPLRWAIMYHNEEGLRIFLNFVKELSERSSWRSPLSSKDVSAHMVKQRIYLYGNDQFCTPLHIAAEYGNISAIEFLLENGANIDECDSNYLSPLECILLMFFADKDKEAHQKNFNKNMAINAAVRLVQLGAATGIVLLCPAVLLLETLPDAIELCELLFQESPVANHKQAPVLWERTSIVFRNWKYVFLNDSLNLQNLMPAFEQTDFGGKSLMHEAICWRGFSALPFGWNSALQSITPFPWHYVWPGLHCLTFLTTSFRLYRRILPHDTFKRIMNLQPERGMSPLCRASSRGILEVMENCLTMGAEIDFEGCSLGSALMIACACGRLDAVKLLVRRGAAISYVGKNGLTSAVMAGHRSKAIIAWLLVGQFNEQKRLNCDDKLSSSSDTDSDIRPWSGIEKAHFQLIGRHQMQRHESSLNYAKRLSELKRRLRGSVVPGRISFPTA